MDSLNNIYIVGSTGFGWPTDPDLFLLKYTNSGELEWEIIWGGSGSDKGYGVVTDSNDNVYVSGSTSSYGPGSVALVLLKFNNEGDILWNSTWGGDSPDYGYYLTIDSSDNLYILGDTQSFGLGLNDICLLKFNKFGVLQWSETWGGPYDDRVVSIKLDSLNNIYVLGEIRTSKKKAFLLKFNDLGIFQWSQIWYENASTYACALEIDSSDNIYVAGKTNQIFLSKYNSLGDLQWDFIWNKGESSSCSTLAFDLYDNIFIAGDFLNYESRSYDASVLEFNSAGKLKNYRVWGGSDIEYGSAIVFDPHGNLYFAGETYSYGNGRTDVFLLKNPSYSISFISNIDIWASLLGSLGGIFCWFALHYHRSRRKIKLTQNDWTRMRRFLGTVIEQPFF